MNRGGWNDSPNKYLWKNGRRWWMRVQPYDPVKAERLAFNLKTEDIEEARRRRDELLAVNKWKFTR